MKSSIKHSLKFSFFAIILAFGLLQRPTPAAAVCDGCVVGAVTATGAANVAAIAAQTVDLNVWLEKVIMGSHSINPIYPVMMASPDPVTGTMIPGTDSMPIVPKGPVLGLVDYFEQIFWPRMLTMEQKKSQTTVQSDAANSTLAQRTLEADQSNRFQQRTDNYRVEAAATGLGVEDSLCPHPSRIQSFLALRAMAQISEVTDTIAFGDELSGSVARFNEGPIRRNLEVMAERNSTGVCDPLGNNKADEAWCTSGNTNRKNNDWLPQPLIQPMALVEDNLDAKNNVQYAKMYIENLFPDKAFDPIRKDLLATKSPEALEVMSNRSSYSAQVQTFQQPFLEAKSQRKLVDSVSSVASLQAVLTRVGYPDQLKEQLMPGGKVAIATAEEIHYKIANLDPQLFVTDYAKAAALSQSNRDSFSFSKLLDAVVLLYDIREQLKTANKMLGTIGSVLTAERFEKIQAKSQGLTSSN